jgi:hypothetical protein
MCLLIEEVPACVVLLSPPVQPLPVEEISPNLP